MAKNYKVFKKEKKIVYVIGSLTEEEKAEVAEYKELADYKVVIKQPAKKSSKGATLKMIDEWIETKSKNKEEDIQERNEAYAKINEGKKAAAKWLGVRSWFKKKYPKVFEEMNSKAKK